MKKVIQRHSILIYFLTTLIISWGGLLIIIRMTGMPAVPSQSDEYFAFALILLLAGPLLTGIILTAFLYGKAGFKSWLLVKVKIRYYILALLGTPAIVLTVLLILTLINKEFMPAIFITDNPISLILLGLSVGILGGVFEELGWTGFLILRLRKVFGIWKTGIILGVFWGIWHLPITLWSSGNEFGNISWELFIAPCVFYVLVLPLYRMLMVCFFEYTQSVLINIIMHASLIFSTLFVFQPQVDWQKFIIFYVLFAISLILLLAGIAKRAKYC